MLEEAHLNAWHAIIQYLISYRPLNFWCKSIEALCGPAYNINWFSLYLHYLVSPLVYSQLSIIHSHITCKDKDCIRFPIPKLYKIINIINHNYYLLYSRNKYYS